MKNSKKIKDQLRQRRKIRTRAKIRGSIQKPRLNVFRSLKHLYIQLIDDNAGKTLVSVKDSEIREKGKKTEIAFKAGELLAQKAIKAGIKELFFDRGGYKYHGRVKAIADGARKGGLKF
ncbi:MAG: 50S ribosomal protein L18 [Candidatus Buchananbacteria bacterium RIFCSPHIGHO2_02_FULL_38_8]|uniref:Large ribosomal subunit protein uL18 n=2 Tax=Candidatus Buchananiibacteriota TaxID=1817903 RepID=A0A1G1XZN3_9BACT|nr:MAG: 50S ribosomal protein L18 [Candidatus Buchananbacteria bacterium RIFCSPHIGHO2_01_FULL_39_8]OGY47533.1 MAG: 50S ribosomal protein L18 [Candidatus Buchananbacteria bacterium RIFCSPHIGHO2_02_FULL_38_8]